MFLITIGIGDFLDKKLKIGIGTDAFPPTTDGVCNVAKNYAQHIHDSLGKTVVITPKNPNKQDHLYPYEIYRYKSWWVPSKEGYSVGWPFKAKFHDEIIKRDFDLLHSHCPLASSYYFRLVVEKKKIPVVLTYHTKYEYDIELRVPTRPAKTFAYHFLCNNINAADEVWVTSEGTAQSLRKVGYTGDYVVMPNGCDMPKCDVEESRKDAVRQKHNIPKDVPVFIYVGRMIWYKNIRLILDACKKLQDKGEDFRLILLGFGANENGIKRHYKKIGIANKVINIGKLLDRERIQDYYATADLLLFPSVFDTNGLVVSEAASCATPSLLIKGSCAAEGFVDKETGFLCEESEDAIANYLKDIMHDKKLLYYVGKEAQDKIYISWEDAVHRAYERYQIVIDNFNKKHNIK